MGSFADQIAAFSRKVELKLDVVEPKALRKALNAGAKVLKDTVKPLVPVLGKSTEYRQKGTVKNNFRHTTKIFGGKRGGQTIVRVRRTKGRKMAPVSANTRDKTDPFYWFMLDRGTKKMKGLNFTLEARQKRMPKAIAEVKRVYLEEMQKK